jgi:hypothetical protein
LRREYGGEYRRKVCLVSLLSSQGAFRPVSQQGDTVATSGSLAGGEFIYGFILSLSGFRIRVTPQSKVIAIGQPHPSIVPLSSVCICQDLDKVLRDNTSVTRDYIRTHEFQCIVVMHIFPTWSLPLIGLTRNGRPPHHADVEVRLVHRSLYCLLFSTLFIWSKSVVFYILNVHVLIHFKDGKR